MVETAQGALELLSAVVEAQRLAVEYRKAERRGEKPSVDAAKPAFKRLLTRFVAADLLVGCQSGRAIALPVRATGGASTTDQVLTMVVFSDREAGEAYFARRRIDQGAFQLVPFSELTGSKPSARVWARLYVASRAYNAILNPCGPYSHKMSRENLLLALKLGKPLFNLHKAEDPSGAPRFMDADQRREFRAGWNKTCDEIDQLLSDGKFDDVSARLAQLDYYSEFMGTCEAADVRRIAGVRAFAIGRDKRGVLDFYGAANDAADNGFPEDAVDRYLIVGSKLRKLLAGSDIDPDWVSLAAIGIAASLEDLLATWDAASVDPYRTAEVEPLIAELRATTGSLPGQRALASGAGSSERSS